MAKALLGIGYVAQRALRLMRIMGYCGVKKMGYQLNAHTHQYYISDDKIAITIC